MPASLESSGFPLTSDIFNSCAQLKRKTAATIAFRAEILYTEGLSPLFATTPASPPAYGEVRSPTRRSRAPDRYGEETRRSNSCSETGPHGLRHRALADNLIDPRHVRVAAHLLIRSLRLEHPEPWRARELAGEMRLLAAIELDDLMTSTALRDALANLMRLKAVGPTVGTASA